ncbi:MAG: response regulator [Holophagaceae bacterium]|nr:response regulator [Holophagaceae bacterium]
MPRLLLVDDNPSIHKIAETLLGSSSIELTCVGSASEALMLLDSGEGFDIALLDTAMPGMDGWELLARMRKHPDSAFIPIAMMAGVLDTVDPEKLKHAPIQGFIKKPIELRELAERVQQLLATPVTLSESEGNEGDPTVLSPFATVPGTKIKSLPEFRGVTNGPPPEEITPRELLNRDDEKDGDEQDDLLLLTPEDFWFEDAPTEPGSDDFLLAQATAQALVEAQNQAPLTLAAPMDATLDLEELDLEALKDLPNEESAQEASLMSEASVVPDASDALEFSTPQRVEEPFAAVVEEPAPSEFADELVLADDGSANAGGLGGLLDVPYEEETLAIPGLAIRAQALSIQEPGPADSPVHEFLSEDMPAPEPSDFGEMEELGDFKPEAPSFEPPAPRGFESQAQPVEAREDAGFPSSAAYALPAAAMALPAVAALHAVTPTESSVVAPPPVAQSATPMALAPAEPITAPMDEGAPRDAAALVQVLMSDPVLMDVLTKAVVARLGDQALREIAWELMPELAEKLPR